MRGTCTSYTSSTTGLLPSLVRGVLACFRGRPCPRTPWEGYSELEQVCEQSMSISPTLGGLTKMVSTSLVLWRHNTNGCILNLFRTCKEHRMCGSLFRVVNKGSLKSTSAQKHKAPVVAIVGRMALRLMSRERTSPGPEDLADGNMVRLPISVSHLKSPGSDDFPTQSTNRDCWKRIPVHNSENSPRILDARVGS